MNSVDAFRILLLCVMAFGIGTRTYFELNARRHGGPIGSYREPRWYWAIAITIMPLILAPVAAFVINPGWLAWSYLPAPLPLRWLGAALMLAVLPGVVWAFRSLGANLTKTATPRRNATLVTHGPYRFVRHPLYAFAMAGWIGITLMLANWLVALGIVAVFLLISYRVPVEEAQLIERFGDAYRDRMRRTGRFLPRFS